MTPIPHAHSSHLPPRHAYLLLLLALFLAIILAESCSSSQPELGAPPTKSADKAPEQLSASFADDLRLSPRRALGQMIVARFSGPKPHPRFLARIRKGEVGGAILFDDNLGADVARLTQRLRRAARRGGNPPLLVMVDQEGGDVKRLPGPPLVAPMKMSDVNRAYSQGRATGEYLRGLGIDVNLAPVADVGHPGTFLGSRVFGSTPSQVARGACAFAAGLRQEGVAATLKHFPGLGLASANTDVTPVTIDAPAATVRADYAPYRLCGSNSLTLIMVSSAIYPSLTGSLPAVMSRRTYDQELPSTGATPVTISDDLEAPAIANQTTPARRAIDAGLDLLLYARSEAASAYAYTRLLADIRSGRIERSSVSAAAIRILDLKIWLGSN